MSDGKIRRRGQRESESGSRVGAPSTESEGLHLPAASARASLPDGKRWWGRGCAEGGAGGAACGSNRQASFDARSLRNAPTPCTRARKRLQARVQPRMRARGGQTSLMIWQPGGDKGLGVGRTTPVGDRAGGSPWHRGRRQPPGPLHRHHHRLPRRRRPSMRGVGPRVPEPDPRREAYRGQTLPHHGRGALCRGGGAEPGAGPATAWV